MSSPVASLKMAVRKCFQLFGYDIVRLYGIQDEDAYAALFAPWDSSRLFPEFEAIRNLTVCSRYSAWAVARLLEQTQAVNGDIIELGVYKGGMALLMERIRAGFAIRKPLRLFDTFAGMPETDPVLDRHKKGDFSDTSLEAVTAVFSGVSDVHFHRGLVQDTLPHANINSVSFVHIDLDIYYAIKASIEYIWPRLSPGGIVVFDDYGFPSCPGARRAVDEFFADIPEKPFLLPFGSCFVEKQ